MECEAWSATFDGWFWLILKLFLKLILDGMADLRRVSVSRWYGRRVNPDLAGAHSFAPRRSSQPGPPEQIVI
jgi:hypothetical protein